MRHIRFDLLELEAWLEFNIAASLKTAEVSRLLPAALTPRIKIRKEHLCTGNIKPLIYTFSLTPAAGWRKKFRKHAMNKASLDGSW